MVSTSGDSTDGYRPDEQRLNQPVYPHSEGGKQDPAESREVSSVHGLGGRVDSDGTSGGLDAKAGEDESQDLVDGIELSADPSGGELTYAESAVTGHSGLSGSRAGEFELSADLEEVPDRLGEYAILSLIGAGGMGRVYLAEHLRMARRVALKTLAPERMRDESAVQRFYSEVRAAARLLHPNIVTAFDAGESAGRHYLAMEYVEGETFSELVGRQGPLPVAEAVRLIMGAATGLAFAHAAGIVHRDVKPGNLMLAADGTVKVLDLGLATIRHDALERPTRRGRLIGTFQYIAPEQLEDPDAADGRADIYSLGATFFYLLAGRSPFEGDMMAQLRQHRDGPIPDLFSVRRDVDLRLDHVFQRMMAKRPQDRYTSLEEALEDLRAWTSSGGTPTWLTGISPTVALGEEPTSGGDPSTTTNVYSALAIDLGMVQLAAAIAEPGGSCEAVNAGGLESPNLRAALSSDGGTLSFGDKAMRHRIDHPQRLVHSVHLYLGQSRVDRRVLEHQCPPEVLLGMLLRQVRVSAWNRKGRPTVVALTVPACYDQLHRRSILQAGEIAGFHSLRLVDRPLAAAQSQLHPRLAAAPLPDPGELQHWVVASLTGLGVEAMVVRHIGGRLETIATSGNWIVGELTWQRRLIDLVAEHCQRAHGIDPRKRLRDASRLQRAVEQAMKDLLLRQQVSVHFRAGGKELSVEVTRQMLSVSGEGVVTSLMRAVTDVLGRANLPTEEIDRVLTIGSLLRLASVRQTLSELLMVGREKDTLDFIPIDRRSLALGASLVAAGELPGRDSTTRPPQAAATYDLGLLAYAGEQTQPTTFPVIPQGTALPAPTGRRLSRQRSGPSGHSITIVESAGADEQPWRALGTYQLPEADLELPLEVIFEVNIDGLLMLRLRNGRTGETTRIPTFPPPMLTTDEVRTWASWVEETAMTQ